MSETDVWDEITADASAFDGLTTEAGSELSDLIRRVGGIGQKLSAAKTVVTDLTKERDRLLYNDIPGKMQEMGVDSVEVEGNTVSLVTFVHGTMPKDPLEKQEAIAHLRAIGCGDFIKNTLSVRFGRTQDNRAKDLYADLEEAGLYPELEEKVESSTLKKVIKDCVQNGVKIDLERFNAHLGTLAKIKGK
jgi:hypothetical protein